MIQIAERKTVKMISFGYLATIYLAIAFAVTVLADYFTSPLDVKKADKAPLWVHIAKVVAYVWYLTVAAYLARGVVKWIPYPLDGIGGYSYATSREIVGFPLFGAMLIGFSRNFSDLLSYTFYRISSRRGRLSLINPA